MYKLALLVFLILDEIAEGYFAYMRYTAMKSLPGDIYLYPSEYIIQAVDLVLRDFVLFGIFLLLVYRRKRIIDRTRRYVPVIVSGLIYLYVAGSMAVQLSLDHGGVTLLNVLAGLNNNIFLVLLAAMCYHKWCGWPMKIVYFVVYLFTNLSMLADCMYFWQTSMHIESVIFQNLNIYAVKGVLFSMGNTMVGYMIVGFVVLCLLFWIPDPQKHKPNFAWSLFCVAVFTLLLNLSVQVLGAASLASVEKFIDDDIQIEHEKSFLVYRGMLTVPMNGNFVVKALFDTDKLATKKSVEQRELTAKDVATLKELGIPEARLKNGEGASAEVPQAGQVMTQGKAKYDRIVLLILESVHRDYINYYNKDMPEQATRFLNELVIKYPHMDRYYSSAIPTTQGLNATFRSHLIFDHDMNGKETPSLFRSVQAAGMRGIFLNASSQYYANEVREYPDQFGMKEYYAKEFLEKQGYTGASGWGFHNDEMYKATLDMLEKMKDERYVFVCKTLDMHQPYPVTGYTYEHTPDAEVRDSPFFAVRGMYWVDRTIKYFFEEAKKRGLMDGRTLFIVTADHNPHSGGEYTQIVTKANDKLSIAPLPLIFVSSNLAPLNDLRTREYASQIDLAPTLLHLLGIKVPDRFMGRDLLQPCQHPYALGYFGGKAFYWSDKMHFVDDMSSTKPNKYEDALSNYIVREYGLWHK